jgi:hypothetical protein
MFGSEGSAAHDERRAFSMRHEQSFQIPRVTRVQNAPSHRCNDGDMGVADIVRFRLAAELSDCTSERIEWSNRAVRKRSTQLDLASFPTPDLGHDRTWNDHVLPCFGGQPKHGPHRSVVSFERDERARVENDTRHRLR